MNVANRSRVVIVGAGFGGLWAARALGRAAIDVTLVDKNNYHTFLPLLYQVAAAELEPEDIIYPVRSILRKYPETHFLMDEVTRVDFDQHCIITRSLDLPYDYLVLSLGSKPHYFGVAGAAEFAFPLKTMQQAVELRNHILGRFEAALYVRDETRRRQMLTFTIVGGGSTGVEFAGALAELVRGPLEKDYPGLDFSQVKLLLLEAADQLLTGLPPSLQSYTLHRLQHMGMDVQLNSVVQEVTPVCVRLRDGTVIPTETVVWTAGVRGEAPYENWNLTGRKNGQVEVQPTLQVPGHPEVFAIGDLAYLEQKGHPLQWVAPVAIQQGEWVARNILRQLNGKGLLPFRYKDAGTMVTIGRNASVAQIGRLNFTGILAWFLWLGVNLYRLIGFRNRLIVLTNWGWDYLFFERVVRLILPSPAHP